MRDYIPRSRCLQDANDQVARSNAGVAEQQRSVHPASLHRLFDVRRQIGYGCCAPRQPIQFLDNVLGQLGGIDLEVPDDAVQIGVLQLEDLLDPMGELHVWIASELAEDGGALDALVREAVQFSE